MKKSILFSFLFFLAGSLITVSSFAGEPTKDPILRTETGMHGTTLRRIGLDSRNRYLVTASDDKTCRVWDLQTGRLTRTLRAPIDKFNEGKIFSATISPDGRHVACAGWTGYDWEDINYIYIFERESGKLLQRLSAKSTGVVNHLAYSKDGKFLLGTLSRNGIRLYRTSDYSLVTDDREYGDYSLGADFYEGSKLVTTSYDGYIRLYSVSSAGLKLLSKVNSVGGSKPFGASFHPNGKKVAISYNDSPKIDVFTVTPNALQYAYSPTSAADDAMVGVTWSADGKFLYAGGGFQKNISGTWTRLILKWPNEGQGPVIEIPACYDMIMHLLPMRNGGIVFGAADPCFGAINNADKKILFKNSYIADFRTNPKNFLVNYDGSVVKFSYELYNRAPAQFSVIDRILKIPPDNTSDLKQAITTTLNITNWEHKHDPKLNGTPIRLQNYEVSRSLAIHPNGQGFVLGSDWNVRYFENNGTLRWEKSSPSTTWLVNISGNGKFVVAGFGDGTIRWLRASDGTEVLALFPHNDRKRWVVWTPSGYYDAAPGADEFIGWHINNGKEKAADFFPISKFRGSYYRPDVIAKAIETSDEAQAIVQANEEAGKKEAQVSLQEMLPPVVYINSPQDGTEVSKNTVSIRYSVRSPSGEVITGIKILVDGRPIATQRGLNVVAKGGSQSEEVRDVDVPIPEKNCEISIIAENKFSASEPAILHVTWKGKQINEAFIIKPKLYILAIGVSKYKDDKLRLGFAAKDAADFAASLVKQKGMLYREVSTKVLTDSDATKDNILDALEWIQKETTSKDVAMIFIAGHGVNDSSGVYYFLPVGADTEKIKRTGVPFTDIKNTITAIAGKALFFVDTCHSGNVMGTRRAVADISGVVNELSSAENGVVVFASSTGKQYSLEDPKWGNGAFTKALIEGLSGKADYTGKGKITINMLDLYISERVKELTKGQQTPTTTKPATIPDFPVAAKK